MIQRYDDQWWIGATVHGPHGDHNYGNWTWDHTGTEITWFTTFCDGEHILFGRLSFDHKKRYQS